MIICGLTGGIGSGKSLVGGIFKVLGLPVFVSDDEARKLFKRADVTAEVAGAFGKDVMTGHGVDLKKLALKVFSDSTALKRLNAIIHPRVMEEFHHWLHELHDTLAAIMESAIIFESGIDQHFDLIIDVYAPAEICKGRITGRDGLSLRQVEQRMNAQLDPEIKREKADIVIVNDGERMLLPQVVAAYRQLLRGIDRP